MYQPDFQAQLFLISCEAMYSQFEMMTNATREAGFPVSDEMTSRMHTLRLRNELLARYINTKDLDAKAEIYTALMKEHPAMFAALSSGTAN